MRKPIILKVRDIESVVFEGEVDRISSHNEVGTFDIFPMHANFITIMNQQITLFNNHQKLKEFKVAQAILKIKKDNAQIFLGLDTLTVDENTSTSQKNDS